ncbi:MAG: hypothetical protein ABSF28_12050 [Terracidiphilus sp.]|jgi:DNA-binding response OmpR family regulator
MLLKVVLAVGVDSWMLAANRTEWRSAGFIVLPATTMREAFEHFQAGDFDLILLGHSLPVESKERLTFLVRSAGSSTPVLSISNSSSDYHPFASATVGNDSNSLLQCMGELLVEASKPHSARTSLIGTA